MYCLTYWDSAGIYHLTGDNKSIFMVWLYLKNKKGFIIDCHNGGMCNPHKGIELPPCQTEIEKVEARTWHD